LDRFASSLSPEHCLFAAADLSPAAAGFAMEVCLSLGSLLILGAEQAKNRMKGKSSFSHPNSDSGTLLGACDVRYLCSSWLATRSNDHGTKANFILISVYLQDIALLILSPDSFHTSAKSPRKNEISQVVCSLRG
jgi:hypothetical protein